MTCSLGKVERLSTLLVIYAISAALGELTISRMWPIVNKAAVTQDKYHPITTVFTESPWTVLEIDFVRLVLLAEHLLFLHLYSPLSPLDCIIYTQYTYKSPSCIRGMLPHSRPLLACIDVRRAVASSNPVTDRQQRHDLALQCLRSVLNHSACVNLKNGVLSHWRFQLRPRPYRSKPAGLFSAAGRIRSGPSTRSFRLTALLIR